MRLNGIMMLEAIPRHLELSLEIFFCKRSRWRNRKKSHNRSVIEGGVTEEAKDS